MADGFMIASECAVWWAEQRDKFKEKLDAYVMQHPDWFGILVAGGGGTLADFGYAFFIDVLKLGEGTAEGSPWGIVQDIGRALSIIPTTRILQGAKPFLGAVTQQVSNLLYWRKLTGDLCAPIAFGQALQRTGQKLYIPLHEIANAIGQPLSTLWADGMNMAHLAEPMRRFGLQFDTFGGGWIAKLDDVFTKAKAADGPIMIGIGGIRQVTTASGALGKAESCHVVLVSKTLTGVKIIDRYGVFSTFEELARRYGVLGDLYINPTRPVFVLKNAVVDEKLLKLADLSSPLACLSRMSLAMFDFNRQRVSPEFVKQDFRRFAESGGSSKNKSTMAN